MSIKKLTMINLMAFMDIEIGLGITLYSDDRVPVREELIYSMICALNSFVKETTSHEEDLVNAILIDVKILIWGPDKNKPLRYVFFTDLHDSDVYIIAKAKAIHNLLHPYINLECFSPPREIMNKITEIAKHTQNLTEKDLSLELVNSIKKRISVMEEKSAIFADLFIGDIDGGIAVSFMHEPKLVETNGHELFSNLMDTFLMDHTLSIISELEPDEEERLKYFVEDTSVYKEAWFLEKLAKTKDSSDFWLLGYYFYKPEYKFQIDECLKKMADDLSEEIKDVLIDRPFK